MKLLTPRLKAAASAAAILTVDLDGTAGFGTSFLEEAFGGLIRNDGLTLDEVERSLRLLSEEEPSLKAEIESYLRDAEEERKSK